MLKYSLYGRGCGVNRGINDEAEGRVVNLPVNAEAVGRGINGRLAPGPRSRDYKEYFTATKYFLHM